MKISKSILNYLFSFGLTFFVAVCLWQRTAYSQTTITDESREQREFKTEDRLESAGKPETINVLIEKLKERAALKMKEQRRKLLLKTRTSAGVTYGHEKNPANDGLEKGDSFMEENFSFAWTPTFHNSVSADVGIRVAKQDYFEQFLISTNDYAVSGSWKFYPFENRKLSIEPGMEYEWLNYPNDSSSSYEQYRSFINFKHFTGKHWQFGGKYEFFEKTYDKKVARNLSQTDLDFHREDFRNTVDLWIKRFVGRYSLKLKGRMYRNNSNDMYQNYNDYEAIRGYFTIDRTFLRDDKLYVSFSPDYERKYYDYRLAGNEIRQDRILQYNLNLYYTLPHDCTLSASYNWRDSNSNASTGVFTDETYRLGLSADF